MQFQRGKLALTKLQVWKAVQPSTDGESDTSSTDEDGVNVDIQASMSSLRSSQKQRHEHFRPTAPYRHLSETEMGHSKSLEKPEQQGPMSSDSSSSESGLWNT